MLRLTALFIAVCVVLISASMGAIVYLLAGFSMMEASVIALAVLTALSLYNMMASRVRDRSDVGDQIADLSRGTADLARQVGEFSRRLTAVENDTKIAMNRARAATDPLATEISDLSILIKQLAETVAAHENALASGAMNLLDMASTPPPAFEAKAENEQTEKVEKTEKAAAPVSAVVESGPFKGKRADEIVAIIQSAIDANRIDLYLQPIVTLPQRKVRYYEGVTRLRTADGELILPADFMPHAEKAGLMPKIDSMQLFRCVQVLRRLAIKNREIGLFCNISIASLQNAESFTHFLQFMEANRALASSLFLEFMQKAVASFGPIENESLAALAERGFRFSIDGVTDLRLEPRALAEQGVRFVKIPATLLLNRTPAAADIHVADLSDLLGRHGVSLIGERIETESAVVDLLDFDVRFGQGFLFSPPRPVRAEALQGLPDRGEPAVREAGTAAPAPRPAEIASAHGTDRPLPAAVLGRA